MNTTPQARRRTAGVAAVALLGAALTLTTTSAQAAPGPTDVIQTFTATSGTLGAIPDATGSSPYVPGVRTVDVPVTGVGSAPSDITLSMTLTHSWVGDLVVKITAPDNTTSVTVLDRVGTPAGATTAGDSSNLAGTYTFTEGASGNMDAAAAPIDTSATVPPGAYAPTAADGSTLVSLAPLRNVAAVNGVWHVVVSDNTPGDTGSITATSLVFATLRSQSQGCKNATAAQATAQAAATQAAANQAQAASTSTVAQARLAQAAAAVSKAKKSKGPKARKAKKVKKAKAALTAASAAASVAQVALATATQQNNAAQAALTSASATRASSC